MAETYSVVVERNRLKFAAAHMATFSGGLEPLHGHNYALHLEVSGTLTPNSWVIDFSLLKRVGHEICGRLDHKFLLQKRSSLLAVAGDENTCTIVFGERTYQFPADDVAALPIDNTTAERLAEWIASEVGRELLARGMDNITRLKVGVEEAPGQAGWYETELAALRGLSAPSLPAVL